MKKALFLLCLTIGLCLFAIAFWPMRTVTASEIPVLSAKEIDTLTETRIFMPVDLPVFSACGEALPYDDDTNTWYTPALTTEVAASVPRPWRIARTEQDALGTFSVILYNSVCCSVCTLTETGLPVIDIQLRRFDLNPKYIEHWRTSASSRILSLSDDGSLQWQNDRIDIKARGDSSYRFYPKKCYTVFFLEESGGSTIRSPIGLPEDRKFALNALYEDDSKIRDALAYRLWEEICPSRTPQLAYAELVLNDSYCGLYAMHQIITENAMHTDADDTVYKIDAGSLSYTTPAFEIAVGSPENAAPLDAFFSVFSSKSPAFPAFCDMDSFADYIVMMEITANTDARLKNMVFVHDGAADRLQLSAWDMDLTFGFRWLDLPPLYFGADPELVTFRYTDFSVEAQFEPINILYASCPELADAVSARYRELRKTVFTGEALLETAAALYDPLTACGARQRDAERWPDSAISEDNSFIEAFIPARMAFLDAEFSAGKAISVP